jgi:16S rRNA (cytidine1402-2'-O)-methyltransferase
MEKGKLSIIATPIGNLEDMTLRAIRVLTEADYVLCEDTRVTGKLLKHYEIETKTKRYDAHASDKAHESILEDLRGGKHIALVSDAGTPGISDPGVFLVERVRRENPDSVIEAIPGPSALTAAFSIAGVKGNEFVFLGFVPQKKGRETFFKSLGSFKMPVIFYESPHRIMKTLESLAKPEDGNRTIIVARELTKMHEEVVRGTGAEVLEYFRQNPEHVRGEFVVIVS